MPEGTAPLAPSLPPGPIGGPAAWRGPEMAARSGEWLHHLSPEELDELAAAVRAHREAGRAMGAISPETFPLPRLAPVLERVEARPARRPRLRGAARPAGRAPRHGRERDRLSRHRQPPRQLPQPERQGPPARPCARPRPRHPEAHGAVLPDQPRARIPHRFLRRGRAALPAHVQIRRRELHRLLRHPARRDAAALARALARAVQRLPDRPARRGAARHAALVRGAGVQLARRTAQHDLLRASTSARRSRTSRRHGGSPTRSARRWPCSTTWPTIPRCT